MYCFVISWNTDSFSANNIDTIRIIVIVLLGIYDMVVFINDMSLTPKP